MRVAAALLVALTGCKDSPTSTPAASPASTSAAPTVAPSAPRDAATVPADRPSAPTAAQPVLGPPLSIDDAAKVIPPLDGKQLLPLRQTSDKRQVHATWCMDGDAADEVAQRVARQIESAGYANVATRGDARKAGVQGDREGFRISLVVSASSAASCPAPKHYFASATIFRS